MSILNLLNPRDNPEMFRPFRIRDNFDPNTPFGKFINTTSKVFDPIGNTSFTPANLFLTLPQAMSGNPLALAGIGIEALRAFVPEDTFEQRMMRDFYDQQFGLDNIGRIQSGIMKGYSPVYGRSGGAGLGPAIDRRIDLLKFDKANRGILKDDGTVVPLSALLGRQFVTPFDTQVTIAYERYDPKRKFNLLKRQIELDGSLAISKDKAERALINGTEAERLFAQDILSIVDSLRESGQDYEGLDQMNVKQFTPTTKDNLVSAASNINTKDIERQFPGTVVAFNPNGNGKNKSNASAGGGGGGEVLNGSNESGASSGTNGFLASSNSDDSTLKSRTMLEIC